MNEERNENGWSGGEAGGKQERADGATGDRGAHRRDVRRHAGRAGDADARERRRVGRAEWFGGEFMPGGAFASGRVGREGNAERGASVWHVLVLVSSPGAWASADEVPDEMLRWAGMLAYARRRRVRAGSLLEQLVADEEAKRAWLEEFPLARLWAATVRIGGGRRRERG